VRVGRAERLAGAPRAAVDGDRHDTGVVVTPIASEQVVAYYAWTMAQIELTDAPARLRKGAGRYPQPVALLGRLGVHRDHEGHGLGAGLLRKDATRLAGTRLYALDSGRPEDCLSAVRHATS
jgi:GNAT superfamily N-acetyltransferase